MHADRQPFTVYVKPFQSVARDRDKRLTGGEEWRTQDDDVIGGSITAHW